MDQLKKRRRPIRTQLTKILNEADGMLKLPNPDKNELRIKLDSMQRTFYGLQEWDEKVKEQLAVDDSADDVIDKEYDDIRQYEDRFATMKMRLEKECDMLPRPLSPAPSEAGTFSTAAGFERRNVQLPKIELQKFNGELKEWLGFWSQFKKIHEDHTLEECDKLHYLMQSMVPGTKAHKIVSSYPQTSENYKEVVETLESTFGNEDLLLQVYVRELLKLVINNVNSRDKIPLDTLVLQLDAHLRSLKALKLEAADPATWLFPLVESSLPEEILLTWQRSPLADKDGSEENPPKTRLDILMEFLKKEVKIKDRMSLVQKGFKDEVTTRSRAKSKQEIDIPSLTGFHISDNCGCLFCGKSHSSQDCFTAMKMSYENKRKILTAKKACFVCLRVGHMANKCRAKVRCTSCGRKHFGIMCNSNQEEHFRPSPDTSSSKSSTDWVQPKSVSFQENSEAGSSQKEKKGILVQKGAGAAQSLTDMHNQVCSAETKLMTTKVVICIGEKKKIVRAFIDPGSQSSYILDSTAKEMGFRSAGEHRAIHSLLGGRQTKVLVHQHYEIPLQQYGGKFTCALEMRGIDKICNTIPRIPRDTQLFSDLKKNKIFVNDVDDQTQPTPEIELLIGGDYSAQLTTGKQVQLNGGITAIETKFGWVLSGGKKLVSSIENNMTMMITTMTSLNAPIEDLWALETLGIHDDAEARTAAQLELEAKEAFTRTITRNEDGRYRVRLPFVEDHPPLPSNKAVAIKRLERTTKKLYDVGKFEVYDFLLKSWDGEFTEKISIENADFGAHYIPHRPVFKESPTTPVRPVFDCSCKVGKSPALNDCLQKGRNFILQIPDLLLRFREKKIGVTSDIEKAFQMIDIDPADRKFLRFLWWEDCALKKLIEYQHQRLVFGATCSPFILGAVLEHHLTNLSPPYQEVAQKLLRGFYVDNYVGSEDNIADYMEFRGTAVKLLADAQMNLRMWTSNVEDLENPDSCITPILGIQWNRIEDTLFVPVSNIRRPEILTKRSLLSTLQKIFDIVGVLAPAVVPIKRMLQKQWIAKCKWDDVLPIDEQKAFDHWFCQIACLEDIHIPRMVTAGVVDRKKWSLHTFTDASSYAYACAVYLRVEHDDGVSVQLLMSKTKIAPAKKITIPRLELLGCFIGSRLASTVIRALKLEDIQTYFWSDSTTALAWIKGRYNLQVFVRNRVKEITEKTKTCDWRHVPGVCNPADLPSRGCSPKELLQSRWWEGPSFLKLSPAEWPSSEEEEGDEMAIMAEVRKEEIVLSAGFLDSATRDYTFAQQVRIMGWVRRFINQATGKSKIVIKKLTEDELHHAEISLLRQVQEESFIENASLNGLPIIQSKSGVFRLKTRLLYRDDLTDFKTPIVLPAKHPLTRKIIMEAHIKHCHGGVNFLLAHRREKYWIIQGRRTIKSVINSCFRCRRYASKPIVVEEAPLPEDRIKNAEPFEVVGVDLAGPLLLKNGEKAWIVLYTCAVYRAVFLDVVTSLSTQAFIKSMSRFVETHGRPSIVYSDNGTNFVGANNRFKGLERDRSTENDLPPIQWKFNPPAASWWGGWWERLIRVVKDLVRKTLGKAVVTQSELREVLKKVEEVINNRPITYISEDPQDLEPLTPAMFLKTPSRLKFPEADSESAKFRTRLQYMLTLKEELKKRFRSEYLALLISRPKKLTRELKQGEIVFISSELRKRMEWQLGRVLEFLPGRDGGARLARVKTREKEMLIPVQRLHPLELEVETSKDLRRSGRLAKQPERLGVVV